MLASAIAAGAVLAAPGTSAVEAVGKLEPNWRRCFEVAGEPGDVAVVNLTPVAADGPGNGLLVSSDVLDAPTASNVNYGPGTVDPNVAMAPIGSDGQVCFENSVHANVHIIADHLGNIVASEFTAADPSGAPKRVLDTRSGAKVAPNGRRCFGVAGSAGDAAIVNLTPVAAEGPGNGQLVSSDVTDPPIASNVNFGPGTVDPNVAVAPIGADGRVCFVNSVHANVHVVADHLGTVAAGAVTAFGGPTRATDTRDGSKVAPNGRECTAVAGGEGDAALVNLTPVAAEAAGYGLLVSSDITSPPDASNVNFGPGTVDPNVAVAPIGADDQVCFVNSRHGQVHIIADHLASLSATAFTLASTSGAPVRVTDSRTDTTGAALLAQLTVAPQDETVPYDQTEWKLWYDADGDCQSTREEVLIRDSQVPVTYTDASKCTVATGLWVDPWSGKSYTDATEVDIDRTVALQNAHPSGAWAWTEDQKVAYASDISNTEAIRVIDFQTNVRKSSRGPESWRPPVEAQWCAYATDWATIKARWDLTVTAAEKAALQEMLGTC